MAYTMVRERFSGISNAEPNSLPQSEFKDIAHGGCRRRRLLLLSGGHKVGEGGTSMTGGYLASQVRQRLIRPILAFREYIFGHILLHFENLDRRAEQIGDEYYNRAASQPADEDFDGDLSGFLEDAHDHALGWYEMMRSLRQTMLNLLAAGLFHLTEQQLAGLSQDAGFEGRRP